MRTQMDTLIYSSVTFYTNVAINDSYLVEKHNPLIHGKNKDFALIRFGSSFSMLHKSQGCQTFGFEHHLCFLKVKVSVESVTSPNFVGIFRDPLLTFPEIALKSVLGYFANRMTNSSKHQLWHNRLAIGKKSSNLHQAHQFPTNCDTQ